MTKVNLDSVLSRIDAELDNSLERLFAFLRIPSVSTDPAYQDHCRLAADHVAQDLASIGFTASVRPTAGHPVVIGAGGNGKGPHVLFYGHYDVQPVDPLELWETPPFEPRIASLPGGRKIIVASAAELQADIALVCDTNMWDAGTPAITTSLRGLVYEEVRIRAADRDLHSGLFGGPAQNPIRVMAQIIAALHDGSGRVALPGFYDGVRELPPDIKADLAALDLTPGDFLGPVGLKVPAGEKDHMLIEQISTRPTCDIHGS